MGSKKRCGLSIWVAASVLLLSGHLVPEAFGESTQVAWTARHDGVPVNESNEAVATVVDGEGNIYVTGTATTRGESYRDSYVTVKYDAAGNELWTAQYGSQGIRSDHATALAVDPDGNVYVTGYSQTKDSRPSYATVKYDSFGNELWVALYNTPGDNTPDYAQALAVDHDGNVYVTGNGGEDYPSSDYTTVKYDAAGNLLWVARYDGPGQYYDKPAAVVVDSAGNVYVTGSSHGIDNLDDYTTIKYDGAGNELWVAHYDGPAHYLDAATALAVDNAGNVYVTGRSTGDGTSRDYATIKYDGAGNELWVARYDGPAQERDTAEALAVDSAGNVYVTGSSQGANDTDYATVKYDSAGNELWVNTYDGPGHEADEAEALAVDNAGNVYVAGSSQGENDTDYATVKYDSAGNELWVNTYDGPGHGPDLARSLAVDTSGNVVVTGGIVMDTQKIFNDDDYDYGTIKYDTNGNQLWVTLKNTLGPSYDVAEKVIVDQAGNVYVTGYLRTIKYDAQGVKMWEDPVGGTSLAVDSGGNLYVTNTPQGTVKYDPEGELLWARADSGCSLALDALGQACVVGYEERPGTGLDFLTVKYDSHGNILWTAWYNGPANDSDWATTITTDRTGNVYITGLTHGVPDSPYSDYATIKYDPEGNELWVARYDGDPAASDIPRALAVDQVGNVYVTGTSLGDYATVKYDPEGNELWAVHYDSSYHLTDSPRAIAVDSSGNVYVSGNSGSYVYPGLFDAEVTDYATIKYNSEGSQLWEARYQGELSLSWSHDIVRDMAVDPSGNVYVTGFVYLISPFDNSAYATLKYNTNGQLLWKAIYDGPYDEEEEAVSLALDALGNVYVTGRSERADTSYDFLTIKYLQVPDWGPAATLPQAAQGSALVPLSQALGWLFSLSLPLLALVAWKLTRRPGVSQSSRA